MDEETATEDITPEGSASPVFLTEEVPIAAEGPDPIAFIEQLRASEEEAGLAALDELREAYPTLSEATLRRMANLPPLE